MVVLPLLFRCRVFLIRPTIRVNVNVCKFSTQNISQWHQTIGYSKTKHMAAADGLRIVTIEPKDSERVLNFIRIHYYPEEPLTIGRSPTKQSKENEDFDMSNIAHGTCLMALETSCQAGGNVLEEKIVGALLAGPKDLNEVAHLFEEAAHLSGTKWGTILQFLACIERDARVFERYNVEKALHTHVLCVDGNQRGKKLGARLMESLVDLGRRMGYPLLTVDCSSLYSIQLVERLGWECVNVVSYADYIGDDGKVVFQPSAPHFQCKTFALRLQN